uniref:Integrase core domain containing protein n=1 Tax=Solanum tuberosum TaxID=4113 RepID=M1D987_SOLTU
MEQMVDRKIQEVNKCLDAFELRVFYRYAPAIDLTTFQMELASLRAKVDALLAPTDIVPESAPAVPEDEVVMTDLFGDTMPPSDSSCVVGKSHRSDHTSDTEEARRLRKKENHQLEAVYH